MMMGCVYVFGGSVFASMSLVLDRPIGPTDATHHNPLNPPPPNQTHHPTPQNKNTNSFFTHLAAAAESEAAAALPLEGAAGAGVLEEVRSLRRGVI